MSVMVREDYNNLTVHLFLSRLGHLCTQWERLLLTSSPVNLVRLQDLQRQLINAFTTRDGHNL